MMVINLTVATLGRILLVLLLNQSSFLMVSACMACVNPWTSFGSHCYIVFTNTMTFDQAEQHCQGLSRPGRPSRLASIMSQVEHDFLGLLIKSSDKSSNQETWIGYRKDNKSETFTWIDGSSSIGGFTNWYPNQPSGDGKYVELFGAIYDYRWNDISASHKLGLVCKMPARFSQ